MKQPAAQVASRPPKPLMIYDGDCNFCKFWILRWQRATAGQVDYIESQDARVAAQFPDLSKQRLDESVQLIETDGRVFSGAEAVFRALAVQPLLSWPLAIYQGVPGLANLSDWGYRFVADNRAVFSFLTRLLWGRQGALPEWKLTSWVFIRLIGLIYFIAFVSLGTQITALVGSRGIFPAAQWMDAGQRAFDQEGKVLERYHALPTLCWWDTSDSFLKFLCVAGALLSLVVVANVAPAPCLFLLWLIYLSLATVCREFLAFQWDVLLLETGWLAIFLAAPQLLPRLRDGPEPSRIVRWLLWWLLFRLMFESGLVKLLSGDTTWRDLSALNYHYETQPLPTWIGWYVHQLPHGFQKVCVGIMFVIELGVPFLIFAPRHLRFVGCFLLMLLQALIFLTGNYCFFNLLTMALCLLLLDDAALSRFLPERLRKRLLPAVEVPRALDPSSPVAQPKLKKGWPVWVTAPLAVVILVVTVNQILGMFRIVQPWAGPVGAVQTWLAPFRSVNTYGLFAVMTTSRPEIIIEGSNDGVTWTPYEFKYKAGDLKRRPGFVAPHQPRVDWQMWFAALGSVRQNQWFINFCARLLQGSPEVLAMMDRNPFPEAPPRYIRAVVYGYHFTTTQERRETGAWWRRELLGEYMPPISLPPAASQDGRGGG